MLDSLRRQQREADEKEVIELRRILNTLISDLYDSIGVAKRDLKDLNDEYGRGAHATQRADSQRPRQRVHKEPDNNRRRTRHAGAGRRS